MYLQSIFYTLVFRENLDFFFLSGHPVITPFEYFTNNCRVVPQNEILQIICYLEYCFQKRRMFIFVNRAKSDLFNIIRIIAVGFELNVRFVRCIWVKQINIFFLTISLFIIFNCFILYYLENYYKFDISIYYFINF